MLKHLKHSIAAPLFIALASCMLLACTAGSSTTASLDTVEADVQLRPVAAGLSEGESGNQHVVYVSDRRGADSLFDRTRQEYDSLLEQYTRLGDASLVPRLNQLQLTMQAASDIPSSSFMITSGDGANPSFGPNCSGGGNSCMCADKCLCISSDDGCTCACGPHGPHLPPGLPGDSLDAAQLPGEAAAGAGS